MATIRFITGNKNKLREAREILTGFEVEGLDIDLPEIQSLDPKEVIRAKLDEARRRRKGALMVEDTSLTLDCMNGLPGPLIKWFLQARGLGWLCTIAWAEGVFGATARTVIGYVDDGGTTSFFEGEVRGRIVRPRGETKFGWDPIFEPDGMRQTFAEMSPSAKNAISMRRMALEELKAHLERAR
jgi:inosine triphosphate pyrophosphatase